MPLSTFLSEKSVRKVYGTDAFHPGAVCVCCDEVENTHTDTCLLSKWIPVMSCLPQANQADQGYSYTAVVWSETCSEAIVCLIYESFIVILNQNYFKRHIY